MSIKENIISFWKQVRRQSSDMFTLFKVGIGVKVPTNKLHVKDSADPIKVEGMTTQLLDASNVTSYNVVQVDSDGVFYKTHHHGGLVTTKLFDKNGTAYLSALGSGNVLVSGDLMISGNDILDDDGTTCITFDSSGNTTIAGTTSGTFSGNLSGNASGLSSTLAVGSGGTGATTFTSNAILTGNGTSAIQAESGLTYDSEILTIGDDDDGSVSIRRTNHSDGAGGTFQIFAGSAGADNSAGGDLQFYAGYGKGSGGGGKFEFISNTTTGTAGDLGAAAVKATLDKDGNLTIAGDLTVTGNDIKDDDGTTCITFDSSGNTTVANTLNASVTGNLTGNASGSSGSCTGNAATATALETTRTINGVNFDGTADITVTAAGSTLSDTVTVAKGGTGATSLADTHILIGNGTSAVETTSSLTYSSSGELLSIGNGDNGRAEIVRTNGDSSNGGGQLRITAGRAVSGGTSNLTGGDLELVGGAGVGDGASGGIRFYNWNTVGSGNSPQVSVNEIAAITGAGNLQLDGGITTGSTSFVNSSGVIQVATQGTIDHDSLANFVAAEHYRWDTDISATATINAANIPTLNQDTTGNADTATNLTAGDKTLAGIITMKGLITDGDRSVTASGDGVAIHVDAMDITDSSTSASGTAGYYNHITFENPRLLATNSSVTTTNASTIYIKGAPVASTNQTITNSYAMYVQGGDSYFGGDIIVAGNDIKDSGGNTIISSDGSGVVTMAGGNIAVGGSNANLNMNSGSDIILEADNNSGSFSSSIQYPDGSGTNRIMLGADSGKVVLANRAANGTVEIRANTASAGGGGEVTVATFEDDKVTISQDLNVTGIVTGKQREVFFQNFFDDIGTTKHYLPFKTRDEQIYIYQEETAVVMPCDGRIVSLTLRLMFISAGADITIGIHTRPVNQSAFSTASWVEEETETITVTADDDSHVLHFAFDNAKHFESSELVSISIQSSADISGSNYWFVTTVVEYDWSTFLGTTSAEIESTP